MQQIIVCERRVIFSENLLHKTVYPVKDPWYTAARLYLETQCALWFLCSTVIMKNKIKCIRHKIFNLNSHVWTSCENKKTKKSVSFCCSSVSAELRVLEVTDRRVGSSQAMGEQTTKYFIFWFMCISLYTANCSKLNIVPALSLGHSLFFHSKIF